MGAIMIGWRRSIEDVTFDEVLPLAPILGLELDVYRQMQDEIDNWKSLFGIPPSKLKDFAEAFRSHPRTL